ncbi:hypothetical protein NKH37_30900 [Mesorhizobium sp. M1217]|uniref:hypothetical protein n=1 Tax=Mesorhizobium sp. M1217 TaxID=2957070 RepID=UPI00333BEE90
MAKSMLAAVREAMTAQDESAVHHEALSSPDGARIMAAFRRADNNLAFETALKGGSRDDHGSLARAGTSRSATAVKPWKLVADGLNANFEMDSSPLSAGNSSVDRDGASPGAVAGKPWKAVSDRLNANFDEK